MTQLLSYCSLALYVFIQILSWAIIIRCLLSWLPSWDNFLSRSIYNLTDPILVPIQSMMRKSSMLANLPVDFSPIIAIVLLDLVSRLL